MERIGFLGLGHDGRGDGRPPRPLRPPGHRLEPHAGPGRRSWSQLGATDAGTPAGVAAASDVILICVSDTPDVEAVLFGPDGVAERRPARAAS